MIILSMYFLYISIPILKEKVNTDTNITVAWRYTSNWEKNELNQLCFRGKKIEYGNNDFVIILLGDSQVESTCTDFEHIAENCLQKSINHKNIKVFSLGAGGYGTDQQFLALKEYYSKGYKADLVLLWFTPENDVINNIFPVHDLKWKTQKPTFTIKDNILSTPQYFDIDTFYSNLPAPGYSFIPYDKTKKYTNILKTEESTKEMQVSGLETGHTYLSMFLSPKPKIIDYGIDLTKKLLSEVNNLCRENHSDFYVFYNKLKSEEIQFSYGQFNYSGEYLASEEKGSVILFDKVLWDNTKEILSEVNNFDIVLDDVNNNILMGNEDRHLNNLGNNRAMQLLSKILFKKSLLKKEENHG